jgi:serine/threonine-protein kinase
VTQADLLAKAQARVGQVLCSKWRLDEVLGVGGFAAVYAATHRAGKRVAIKLLHADLAAFDDIGRRFLREAYVANTVEHPGIVSVTDDDVAADGSPFLVMDLLEGDTLEGIRRARGGRLPVGEVLSWAEQALDMLAAAHDQGVIHRDIKPHNLFLQKDGRLRLFDFGIARLNESRHGEGPQSMRALGSPAYMPPEQAIGHGSSIDGRADIWALGASMFTLLTGELVHGRLPSEERLLAAAIQHAPALRVVAPDAPIEVARVIDRALMFDRAQRFEDVRAMSQAIRAARAAMKPQALTRTLAKPGPRLPAELPFSAPPKPESASDDSPSERDVTRRSALPVALATRTLPPPGPARPGAPLHWKIALAVASVVAFAALVTSVRRDESGPAASPPPALAAAAPTRLRARPPGSASATSTATAKASGAPSASGVPQDAGRR